MRAGLLCWLAGVTFYLCSGKHTDALDVVIMSVWSCLPRTQTISN